ncbi:calcineurin-like phosphoesterase C-terminal domain-containing protein [Autumnicola musiva]|uniref:Calcineurin-like phosphoesterase C-terminal domain-containing protein n=1 Tax=Autumnicola musiva TaxID=3075589 RepID=A0ABU3DAT6_9FLAO|nr:calcineurin-like phosphoesterase C-terminal domain-containing protein [Zunongwangia sp. F117]MDT0678638.1 calcineurin-like phosphoesterase C-terminal domain-containing protein [Zunongwangia sp. F117]
MAQNSVKGYVYEDTNNNAKKDRRETGIANVAVTNGTQVVLTDNKGKYELPVSDDDIIFVIKPSGYMLKTNENKLPQFYYLHKPNGSPEAEFKGVSATGKLPNSLDFGLLPSEEKEEFTAIIFGDPQPRDLKEIDYFTRGVVSEVEGIKNVLFGISMGDLVNNDLDLFKPYIEAAQKIGIPWYNLMGNHDMNFDAKEDKFSDETYEAHFGPANYAFNYGKVHFILLDNILYPDPRDEEGYWGGFREDQLDFVENDLRFVPKDHLVVLAFHIPLSEPERDTFRDEDRERLFGMLKDYPHTLSLSAHTHIQKQDFFGKEEGWQREKPHHEYNVGTTSGDWYSGRLNKEGIPISTMRDGTPKGYAFIHFNGANYDVEYKVAGKEKDYQINIFAPKVIAKGHGKQARLFANFFMGTSGDDVRYRIDEGDWEEMIYVEEHDPSFEALVYEWYQSNEVMPNRLYSGAINSKHLWLGSLPDNLEAGEHTIEVKATDMYDKTFTATGNYRLEEIK